MADPIYLRVQEKILNKPNTSSFPNNPNNPNITNSSWNMQYDPNKMNQTVYMQGIQPQKIRQTGVYEQVPGKELPYRPRPPRKGRVYYEQEEPISRIQKRIPEAPIKSRKIKPVWEDLFRED